MKQSCMIHALDIIPLQMHEYGDTLFITIISVIIKSTRSRSLPDFTGLRLYGLLPGIQKTFDHLTPQNLLGTANNIVIDSKKRKKCSPSLPYETKVANSSNFCPKCRNT